VSDIPHHDRETVPPVEASRLTYEGPDDRSGAVPTPTPFSPFVTGLAALILSGSVILFVWLQVTVAPLSRVDKPDRALALMVDRSMDLEEALQRVPLWERWVLELNTSDRGDALAEALGWYEELAASTPGAPVQLQLAILEAESAKLDQVRRKVPAWAHAPEPFPIFARFLAAAYLESNLDRTEEAALQAELAERLSAGWFSDRLAIGLATHAGDQSLLASIRAAQVGRTEPLLVRIRLLSGAQVLCLVVGLAALALIVVRQSDRQAFRVGTASVPPLWRGNVGVTVLIRGGAISALLTLAVLSVETDNLLVRGLVIPLTNVPVLLLASRHLFGPTGMGTVRSLGLRPLPASWSRLGLVTAAVLAAALLGETILGQAATWLDLSSHWTEWFDADLAWGGASVMTVSLLEYVLFAPLFEELVFRGLLFATLRRTYRWGTAAAISAGIFALAHGYGVLGTVSVFWSGVLWAWCYEKTGSLLPGMAAHMLNNLLVCATVMALLR